MNKIEQAEQYALLHRRHVRLCICGEVWNGFVLDREGRYLRVRVQDGGEVYALPNEIEVDL